MRLAQGTLLLLLAIFVAGCSSSLDLTKASTQLDVGVRAARDNLWREALFRFQRAVQIDPANAMAQNNLAVAYEGIGEFDKARQAYSEALKLDRSNEYIQKNYSRFVEFYSKNRKRERGLPSRDSETASATAGDTAPETGTPPTQPGRVPTAQPDPPQPPVASPPTTGQPDKPPFGGAE